MDFLNNCYRGFKKYFLYIVIGAILLFSYTLYFLLKKSENNLDLTSVFMILYLNIFLISIISIYMTAKVKKFFKVKKEIPGTRFRKQIIILFSCITIIPSACVFIFGVSFFYIGIENLFKTPVKGAIDNASNIASIYINDMKFTMENFVNGVSERISTCINGYSKDNNQIQNILASETEKLKIDAAVLQIIENNQVNILGKSPFCLSLQFQNIPKDIEYLMPGEVYSWDSDNSVFAIQMVNPNLGIFLLASTEIDQNVTNYQYKIKKAITEYSNLATQRYGLKITFMTVFAVVTMLLLLISIFIGIIFANWILKPVNKLIIAAKNVSSGDYNNHIKIEKIKNEWDILISTFNNMTSKLEQQKQQLIISNKQNAWRDIARKIAHEIKNPLTPIQLSAERLKNKYQKEIKTTPEIFNSCLDTIIRQVNCIGTLVNEFSNFARMPAPKIEDTDIIKLLKEAVFIQSNAHKNITFHQHYSSNKLICKIDPSQINQVMMNIIQNAINSILENSKKNILNNDEIVGNIYIDSYLDNKNIYIIIEDDGPGFSELSIKKALEPYYTTRESGNGLGLAIVHKIINDHRGEINLGRSQILKGAKVFIKIPYISKNINNEENYAI